MATHGNAAGGTAMLRFDDGAVQFRLRIAVSLLSHQPLLIRNIRPKDIVAPGLRHYEVSFLRLIDNLTNGSRLEINNTGTQVRFFPGILTGGHVEHACPVESVVSNNEEDDGAFSNSLLTRSIGWFLQGILPLAPFGKEPLSVSFTGVTDGASQLDPSVDYWKASALKLLPHFGIGMVDADDHLFSPQTPSIRVIRRGAAPLGGGRVEFYCPMVRDQLLPLDLVDVGKFKRIRGTAISCKIVSSSMAARVAFAAKGLLQRLIPDIWIHTDAHTMKQNQCGPSPSVSLILTAESTTGVVMTAECCLDYNGNKQSSPELADDLGVRGAALLLEEIRRGGCVDTSMQSIALLWMCLTPEDISRLRIGTLTQYTIEALRLYKQALGVEFKIKADHEDKTVLLSCLGTGYRNMARAAT